MKTVVITGSARGFGFEMAKCFREKNYNVVICDLNKEALENASKELAKINSKGKVLDYILDIIDYGNTKDMIDDVVSKIKTIDIWINNAGVNQSERAIWELDEKEINRLIDVDLKGTILCSNLILKHFEKNNNGAIYNVEGYGSNDAKMLGLSIYGTAKRAITYFTEALAKEVETRKLNVKVGKITPGIMITNFINTSLGDGEKITLSEKTKNVYNILGDRPETIARFMVDKIDKNNKNNVKFTFLTNARASGRFIKALFGKKNNYFE